MTSDDDTVSGGSVDPAVDPTVGVPVPEDDAARELEAIRDRHLRLAAEFENFRKRTREEFLGAEARAQARLLGTLLEVFDDFPRVQAVDPETASADSVLEGVAMMERKLHHLLGEAGAEILNPEGELFDPETMEAVMRVSASDPEDDNRVARVLQFGMLLRGNLVRPARVAVMKAD